MASFQGYINKILAKKLNVFVIVYLNDILIYIKDNNQGYVEAVWWVFKKLRKHSLYINLKKYHFYKDEIWFLRYVILAQGVQIEDERIKVVKNWFEPKLIRDIQVFLNFANFYWCFTQSFSKIARPLISMLKTSSITQSAENPPLIMAEIDEIGNDVGDCKDETVKKLLRSKNSNEIIGLKIQTESLVFEPSMLSGPLCNEDQYLPS